MGTVLSKTFSKKSYQASENLFFGKQKTLAAAQVLPIKQEVRGQQIVMTAANAKNEKLHSRSHIHTRLSPNPSPKFHLHETKSIWFFFFLPETPYGSPETHIIDDSYTHSHDPPRLRTHEEEGSIKSSAQPAKTVAPSSRPSARRFPPRKPPKPFLRPH